MKKQNLIDLERWRNCPSSCKQESLIPNSKEDTDKEFRRLNIVIIIGAIVIITIYSLSIPLIFRG